MDNPLLAQSTLPNFTHIVPEQIEPVLKTIIAKNRLLINELLSSGPGFTWDTLIPPLEDMNDELAKIWSPVSHLHSVAETDTLRAAYNACLPILMEYYTELTQNELLHQALQSIAERKDFAELNAAQRKVIENELRDTKLGGVALPPLEKARFAELQKTLSKLSTQFSENVLDATHAWTFHVTDISALKGLTPQTLELLEQNAAQQDKKGWLISLDSSCYSTVMKYLDNRELRWSLYVAFVTRASDQGPHAGRWDNAPIMEDILKIRHELATLLGFNNFTEYSLATKMASKPKQVLNFLYDLAEKSKKIAEHELQTLREFAHTTDGLSELESWDMAFYSEKLRLEQFALQQEELRQYFPIDKVLSGMFTVVNKLYGIKVTQRHDVDVWHPHVQFFEVFDEQDQLRGGFYIDLYARPHKREGAWMDDCRSRRVLADGTIQSPVAFLTCNFTRPLGGRPALLTHDDVLTLFHEFGHCLHHILTTVNYSHLAGINGVPWDAVEVPSQFMEHWCWEKETLALISQHVETGEPLPDALYNKLLATKNFQSGLHMKRQLEFALFDFRLHLEYDPAQKGQTQPLLDEIRQMLAINQTPSFNRFQNTFSHIFSGGYAAGYYSYLWADILSCDAYSKFEETGIFNHATGLAFLKNILEKGGTQHPMDLFIAFRGREPSIEALLRHNGLQKGGLQEEFPKGKING
jgi:oligopeptidase A